MQGDNNRCDPVLLNRYFDQEIGKDENDSLIEHLKECIYCQKMLRRNSAIAAFLNAGLNKEVSLVDPNRFEEKIMKLIEREQAPWRKSVLYLYKAKNRLIPVTAAVIALVFLVFLIGHPVDESGPSAIISSFAGDTTSVVLMETPKTHQTIIWFNEVFIGNANTGSG